MAKQFHLIIAAYVLLMILHLGTALFLFGMKLGWSPDSIQSFYLGDNQTYAVGRSRLGLIETAVPHLISIATTAFILSHFLLFVPTVSTRTKLIIGALFPISGLADIAAGFFILYYGSGFVFLKFASFIIFQLSYFVVLWILLKASLLESGTPPKAGVVPKVISPAS